MILINTASRIREAIDNPVLTARIDDSLSDLKTFLCILSFMPCLRLWGKTVSL